MSEHPEDDLPEQIRVRREKRQRLLDEGVAAYPLAVPRTKAPGPWIERSTWLSAAK